MSLHKICDSHMVKTLVCDQGIEGPILTLNTMKDSHVDKSWLTWCGKKKYTLAVHLWWHDNNLWRPRQQFSYDQLLCPSS